MLPYVANVATGCTDREAVAVAFRRAKSKNHFENIGVSAHGEESPNTVFSGLQRRWFDWYREASSREFPSCHRHLPMAVSSAQGFRKARGEADWPPDTLGLLEQSCLVDSAISV